MRRKKLRVPTTEKTVGTQEGKLKQDAYRKKHPTERTT